MASWFLVGMSMFLVVFHGCSAFKVSYELDDRFIDYRKDAKWLVMFYAPWCHHCHKSEPVWEQVAQTFNQQEASVGLRVGKIDATKQTKSASEFKVKGFPTIKFIHGDRIVTYEGERTREDIEDFALKVLGPAVRKISALGELRAAEKKHEVFFILITNLASVGESESTETSDQLKNNYQSAAEDLMTTTYFFQTDSRLASGNIPFKECPAAAVYKEGKYYVFDGKSDVKDWISTERMPTFPKISGGNFYQMIELKKLMAIAVVEMPAYRATMNAQSRNFFDGLHEAATDREKYHQVFSFGYMDGNEIINQVTAQWVDLPSLVVYDPLHEVYYVAPQLTQTAQMEKASIEQFLDSIINGQIQGVGGKGWFRKAYKFGYSIAAYFYKMFSTQPILSSILFGLPLGILCIIIVMTYTNDCTETNNPESDTESDREKEE